MDFDALPRSNVVNLAATVAICASTATATASHSVHHGVISARYLHVAFQAAWLGHKNLRPMCVFAAMSGDLGTGTDRCPGRRL